METLYSERMFYFGGIIVFFLRLKKWILWVSGIILLLAAAVFSYAYINKTPGIYGRIHPNSSPEAEMSESYINKNLDQEKTHLLSMEATKTISETTMKLERFYTSCGHTYVEEYPMENRYIGKTKEELQTLFPNWHLKSFTSEQVVFRMELNGYCPDHYIIKGDEGYLVILRSDKNTGIPLIVEVMKIPIERLSSEMQEQIIEGIVVDSIEAVEQLLENWES